MFNTAKFDRRTISVGPIVPEICESREEIKKNKMIVVFFYLVGPILVLSAEKRTERSNVYGLIRY